MSLPVATRHMLPTEMLLSLISGIVGMSAWVGQGVLHQIIREDGEFFGISSNAIWGMCLVLPSIALLIASSWEWASGRYWHAPKLRRSADRRFWPAAILAIGHLSLLFMLFAEGSYIRVFSVSAQAPVCAGFLIWCAYKTRRLSVALDPSIRTEKLCRSLRGRW